MPETQQSDPRALEQRQTVQRRLESDAVVAQVQRLESRGLETPQERLKSVASEFIVTQSERPILFVLREEVVEAAHVGVGEFW